MIDKVLDSCTIIPDWLYVKRDADHQLRNIVDGMGRPGYVLVSRQMGKTNLMLNAKRELENEDVIFIYVDMSIRIDNVKECFRNIIDIALRSHYDNFNVIEQNIESNRIKYQSIPPNLEYERELLVLLKTYSGRIVIVLDEIDALASANYSDQIFAQIRSTYFAGRTNYKEFNRLTYILSGVMEPSNIIKDKNISPFNIGKKIYLNDFTYEEYTEFINKLKIPVDVDIKDEVYDILSGHPRMTWDVWSKLEDIYISNGKISKEDVERQIDNMYINNFDYPPVDNIRDIVKGNYELRRALKKLNDNDSDISDELKSQLYLAGIIKYTNDGMQNIKIKNKVIAKCLTNEWLETVDISNNSFYVLAKEQEALKNYDNAINYFIKYVDNYTGTDDTHKVKAYTAIGDCYLAQCRYSDAKQYYILSNNEKSVRSAGYQELNSMRIAITHIKLEEYDEANAIYKQLLKSGKLDIVSMRQVQLNYANSLLRIDFDNNIAVAKEIFENLIADIENDDAIDENEANELLVVAFYNLARIFSKKIDIPNAVVYYGKALDVSSLHLKPYLYLCIIRIYEHAEDKIKYLGNATKLIIDNNIPIASSDNDSDDDSLLGVALNYAIMYELLFMAIELKSYVLYDELKTYFIETVDDLNHHDVIKTVIIAAYDIKGVVAGSRISNDIISFYEEYNSRPDELLSAYKILANIKNKYKQNYIQEANKYIELFQQATDVNYKIAYDDLLLFVLTALHYRNINKHEKAINVCKLAIGFYDTCDVELRINFVGLFYIISSVSEILRNKIQAVEYAKRTLNAIKQNKIESCKIMDIQQLDDIKMNCDRIIRTCTVNDPIIVKNKIGRNEPCHCGSGLKYKKCHGK